MMAVEPILLDTGIGNLGNLERAFRALGAKPKITSSPQVVADSPCLVLPGVGAFRPPREKLRGELEDALSRALGEGAVLLGICVGFQLLFEAGEEFGETDGLGLVAGRVRELPDSVQRPHIGWNRLHDLADHPLLDGVREGDHAYFVHSFAPFGVPESSTLARATHGVPFAAMVRAPAAKGRVFGAQFHPEKSGRTGLRVLGNFLEIASAGGSIAGPVSPTTAGTA